MHGDAPANSVPLIDLSTFHSGTDKAAVVREVAQACRDVGFFVVRGHGVPQRQIDEVIEASVRLFQWPSAAKKRLTPRDPGTSRGYSELGAMSLGRSQGDDAPSDIRETFRISNFHNREGTESGLDPTMTALFAPNIWPAESEIPGFRPAFEQLYTTLETLAATLMGVFALALELPETFFDDKLDRHLSSLAAYHYPPLQGAPETGRVRAGAHTDFGSLTLVFGHPSISGLQVWRGGEWRDVPAVQGSFVVNLGDLMAQWTNDLWVSTLHRVVSSDESDWNRARYSLAFFHQPNHDCLVESVDRHNPPRYAPVTSGEHFRRKMTAMRMASPATGRADARTG
jgi:isopenicillin N synthase-like dioxygenase